MTALFVMPKQVAWDDGTIVPGGKLTFTTTLTTTPQNTYQDEALATPHANPVVADADGIFAPIYLSPTLPSYRVKFTDANDVLIWQTDGVPANANTAGSFRVQATAPYIQWYDTDGTANQRKMRATLTTSGLEIAQLSDDEGAVTPLETLFWAYPSPSGTFTGTLSGMTGSTTGTFAYRVVRGVCTLYRNGGAPVSGTSNAATMSLSGLPAAITPPIDRQVPSTMYDNGNICAGQASVRSSNSTVLFALGVVSGTQVQISPTGGFTTSGTKGVSSDWSITYPL